MGAGGPSGGGKTTIARLIPRFFDVQAGAVLLGGRDVRSIPTAELMEQISFCLSGGAAV